MFNWLRGWWGGPPPSATDDGPSQHESSTRASFAPSGPSGEVWVCACKTENVGGDVCGGCREKAPWHKDMMDLYMRAPSGVVTSLPDGSSVRTVSTDGGGSVMEFLDDDAPTASRPAVEFTFEYDEDASGEASSAPAPIPAPSAPSVTTAGISPPSAGFSPPPGMTDKYAGIDYAAALRASAMTGTGDTPTAAMPSAPRYHKIVIDPEADGESSSPDGEEVFFDADGPPMGGARSASYADMDDGHAGPRPASHMFAPHAFGMTVAPGVNDRYGGIDYAAALRASAMGDFGDADGPRR